MYLAFLLAAPEEAPRLLRYAEAAHRQGHKVSLFVTGRAVEILAGPLVERLCAVSRVVACAQTVQKFAIRAHPEVLLGSQFDHAELAGSADRFLAFT